MVDVFRIYLSLRPSPSLFLFSLPLPEFLVSLPLPLFLFSLPLPLSYQSPSLSAILPLCFQSPFLSLCVPSLPLSSSLFPFSLPLPLCSYSPFLSLSLCIPIFYIYSYFDSLLPFSYPYIIFLNPSFLLSTNAKLPCVTWYYESMLQTPERCLQLMGNTSESLSFI